MFTKRLLSMAVVAAALTLASPSAAMAGTATTAVGVLTATQPSDYHGCDEQGANVRVSVAGGSPNTTYTVSAVAYGFGGGPTSFNTNGSGAGAVTLGSVMDDAPITGPETAHAEGIATISVTANGLTGQVTVYVFCAGGWGD